MANNQDNPVQHLARALASLHQAAGNALAGAQAGLQYHAQQLQAHVTQLQANVGSHIAAVHKNTHRAAMPAVRDWFALQLPQQHTFICSVTTHRLYRCMLAPQGRHSQWSTM